MAAGFPLSLGAANPRDSADEVVTLPPFIVEGKGHPLRWRHLSLPGFEVLAVCDDAVTERFVERCLRLEQLLRLILPEKYQAKSCIPEKLILFNEDLMHARSQEVMEEMMQRAGAKMPDRPAPPLFPWEIVGSSAPWPRWKMRVLPNLRLWDADTTVVFASVPEHRVVPMDFTYQVDRITDLLKRRSPALPAWLVEGITGVYRQTNLKTAYAQFAPALWSSAEESRAIAADPDRPRTLLPIQELLASPREASTELQEIWRVQCALFVRWAAVENSGARRDSLWKLIDRLEHEPLTEQLFQECFGFGFAEMRDRLSDYLPVAAASNVILRPESLPNLRESNIRAATDLEIARICGEWERLEIIHIKKTLPELTQKYVEQARRRVNGLDRDGIRDPDLLAVRALVEIDGGNPSAAFEDLESAAAGGMMRPRALLELALLRQQKFLVETADGKLDAEQRAQVLQPLNLACTQEPALPEVYVLMAKQWSEVPKPPVDALLRLNAGIRRFPQISPLVLLGVVCNINGGLKEPAIELATVGLLHAQDPKMREHLQRILNDLKGKAG
jgi:hypothetical protein